MIQDWDRLVMIGIGGLISLYIGRDGYKFWKKGKYLAVVGVALLILTAMGAPVALVFLGKQLR